MRCIVDIETNHLTNPTRVWCIVAKDIDSGLVYRFSKETTSTFRDFSQRIDYWIGHNLIGYDLIWLDKLLDVRVNPDQVCDTLVLSHLLNYSLEGGHSLEAWGERLGIKKVGLNIDFSVYSDEIPRRCEVDVEINHKVYTYLMGKLDRPEFSKAIKTEHSMAFVCRKMQHDGFKFDIQGAHRIRDDLRKRIGVLDEQLMTAFPPKAVFLREITPRLTKHGTISRSNIPRDWKDFTILSADSPFSLVDWQPFNPGSPTQIVERLNEAGWRPTDKTKGHIEAEKAKDKQALAKFRLTGWKVNEVNLSTLPDTAPPAAKKLVERLLLSGRERTLTEWIESYDPDDGRIHARFNSIGTWTHRMSHTNPNLGNVAAPKSIKYSGRELKDQATVLGKQMRALYTSTSKDWWLVGTDAVGIQLRIFAHYINDPKFTEALLEGDPHSLNASILGCTRDLAKTFIYAFLLGAGDAKIGEILGVGTRGGKQAKDGYVQSFPGLAKLRRQVIPSDARRGYFQSFDGRLVACNSEHLMMAGYLQTGEACVMKHANLLWRRRADELGIVYRQVNFVHDEYQTEVKGSYETAARLGSIQRAAISAVGRQFKLNCPMAGDTKIGRTWYDTH